MLTGDQETKDLFKYQSRHGVRSIGQAYLTGARLEELVLLVPEGILTGFHLKDILDSTKKYTELRTKLYDCIMFNKRFPKTLLHDFTSKEEDKRSTALDSKESNENSAKAKIRVDLVKLFGDLRAPECVKRLQK
jgi:hypothetical protein